MMLFVLGFLCGSIMVAVGLLVRARLDESSRSEEL